VSYSASVTCYFLTIMFATIVDFCFVFCISLVQTNNCNFISDNFISNKLIPFRFASCLQNILGSTPRRIRNPRHLLPLLRSNLRPLPHRLLGQLPPQTGISRRGGLVHRHGRQHPQWKRQCQFNECRSGWSGSIHFPRGVVGHERWIPRRFGNAFLSSRRIAHRQQCLCRFRVGRFVDSAGGLVGGEGWIFPQCLVCFLFFFR